MKVYRFHENIQKQRRSEEQEIFLLTSSRILLALSLPALSLTDWPGKMHPLYLSLDIFLSRSLSVCLSVSQSISVCLSVPISLGVYLSVRSISRFVFSGLPPKSPQISWPEVGTPGSSRKPLSKPCRR